VKGPVTGYGGLESSLKVLNRFWSETYHVGFKRLVERSQLAMLRASDLGRPEDHSRYFVFITLEPAVE